MDTGLASVDVDGRRAAEPTGGGLREVTVASAADAGGYPTWT